MLQIYKGLIVDNEPKPFKLRGISLGGWLMMEGYMLGGRNIPEQLFKKTLSEIYGPPFVEEFSSKFRANFIQETDFATIKQLGFNCVRLPFNYRLLEEAGGLAYLQKIVAQIAKQQLYVILDMHAVPGAQNNDWHSDSTGQALFWEDDSYRQKYLDLWKLLAQTFKNDQWIAGYDIMNEAVTDNLSLLRDVYQQTIETIRKTGDDHIIFLEGNQWARDIDFIREIKGDNLAISIHFYEPIEFTFNWLPETTYPGSVNGCIWDKAEMARRLKRYADFAKRLERPIYVGEFGVASRCPCCNKEFRWVEDILAIFDEQNFHWTYWTYKSVKGMDVPDGLFQLSENGGLIGRKSMISGMENFYAIIKDRKAEFFNVWQTKNFKLHNPLYQIFKPYLTAIINKT